MNENDVLLQKATQAYSEKRNPSAPIRGIRLTSLVERYVTAQGSQYEAEALQCDMDFRKRLHLCLVGNRTTGAVYHLRKKSHRK